jgi:hypothetical protein
MAIEFCLNAKMSKSTWRMSSHTYYLVIWAFTVHMSLACYVYALGLRSILIFLYLEGGEVLLGLGWKIYLLRVIFIGFSSIPLVL